jgi:hypothetical protein
MEWGDFMGYSKRGKKGREGNKGRERKGGK